jgi:phage terminase large subunit
MLRVFVDNDDSYYFEEEYYQTGKTTEEVIEYLKTWSPDYVYPDPAEPDRNRMLSEAGFYVRDVNKDIKAGIDKVRELFRNNKIRINEKCKNFIRELESYQYDDSTMKEIPVKENDHTQDCMRYVLFMHSPKRNLAKEYVFEEEILYNDIGL